MVAHNQRSVKNTQQQHTHWVKCSWNAQPLQHKPAQVTKQLLKCPCCNNRALHIHFAAETIHTNLQFAGESVLLAIFEGVHSPINSDLGSVVLHTDTELDEDACECDGEDDCRHPDFHDPRSTALDCHVPATHQFIQRSCSPGALVSMRLKVLVSHEKICRLAKSQAQL